MKIAIAFGKTLRKWRVSRELTQSELAERSGLDRTFVSLLERGERQPTLQSLFQLCKTLKVNPSEIVRQTEVYSRNARVSRRSPSASRRL